MGYFYGKEEHKRVSELVAKLRLMRNRTGEPMYNIVKEARPGNGGVFINYYDSLHPLDCRLDDNGNCIDHEPKNYIAMGFIPDESELEE